MSFLQPGLLLALPMIALPVIIHLINRQRHRTVSWAAMMFLLDAKKMTRGMAKLRQWIILLMRMLAVAGLIFALSRPLAGLWFGSVAGGVTDTTIILLDRSASMEQQNLQTGLSKRATALSKLSEMLEKTNRGLRPGPPPPRLTFLPYWNVELNILMRISQDVPTYGFARTCGRMTGMR
jgi:hypothetical protein